MPAPVTQVNYEQLANIIRSLQQEEADLRQHFDSLRARRSALESEWQGQAARAFYAEMDQAMQPAWERLLSALLETARTVEVISRIYQEAEEEAAAGFRGEGGSVLGSDEMPGLWNDVQRFFRQVFDIKVSLNEGIEAMLKTPAGKDLIEYAKNNNVTFVIDGEKYGYEGEDGKEIPVTFEQMSDELGGGYNQDTTKIELNQNVLFTPLDLADTMGHEMQHAVDHQVELGNKTAPYPWESTSEADVMGFAQASPAQQAIVEQNMGQSLERVMDFEIRAWERGESISDGSSFDDDGVNTGAERQHILDSPENGGHGYEAYYEEMLAQTYPGMDFDIFVNDAGHVQVEITPLYPADDAFWVTA